MLPNKRAGHFSLCSVRSSSGDTCCGFHFFIRMTVSLLSNFMLSIAARRSSSEILR